MTQEKRTTVTRFGFRPDSRHIRTSGARGLPLAFLATVAALPLPAFAQLSGEGLPDLSGIADSIAQAAAPKTATAGAAFSSGLKVPSVSPGATAKGIGHQLREKIETASGKPQPALQQLEDGMPNALKQLEDQLAKIGFARRDFGVATGYFFITTYETATGKTVPQGASEAAGKIVARAVADHWGSGFRKIAPERQEAAYETLLITPTLLNAFATQFDKAGKTTEANGMRQAAASLFEKLFGTAPGNVTIDAQGKISGLKAAAAPAPATSTTTSAASNASRPGRPGKPVLPAGGLVPASLHGAQVFVRYVTPDPFNATNSFRELVIFPDGSAFDGLPDDPLPSFDPETIRKYSKSYDIGNWKKAGNRLILTFNGKSESWVRHESGGWADPEQASGSYNIYFPVKPATKAQLLGAWKSKSLVTSGFAGGGAPMVAAGSNSDLNFAADGTFSRSRKGFASATTANMGDAFKTGGDVTTSGANQSGANGKWRLDGPLLTLVENGHRGVQLAYILPHWNDPKQPPEMLIRGDWWFRPGRD